MEKYTYKVAIKLKKEYDNGATQRDLDRKYKIDSYWLFKKYGLKCRTSSETKTKYRKNCINLNWNFDFVNNEIQAYIIGFLLSDGSHNGSQIEFKQSLKDFELIEKLRNYFSEKLTINYYKNSCGFRISSKVACENLINLGVCKNKTHKELSIPKIPENLIRHFIRGYFDGDGSIFVCTVNKIPKYLKGNICSPTENILKEIQLELFKYNIESTINKESRKGKLMKIPSGMSICSQDMYRLFFRKKDSINKLYHYLYDDATIYLSRKKSVFEDNKIFYDNSEINSDISKGSESSYSVESE